MPSKKALLARCRRQLERTEGEALRQRALFERGDYTQEQLEFALRLVSQIQEDMRAKIARLRQEIEEGLES